jgi:hypothetical protein
VNEAPTFGELKCSIKEDAVAGSACSGFVTASDVDANDVLTYTVTSSGSLFAVNGASGIVTLLPSAVLNYEVTRSYTVGVMVTDSGGLRATANLIVSVEDVAEAPTLQSVSFDVLESSTEGRSLGVPLVARDEDAFSTFTWSIVGGDVDLASITPSGQLVQTVSSLDFESTSRYSLEVKVTDPTGLSAVATVTVNVLNVNDVTVDGFEGDVVHSTVGGTVSGERVIVVGTNFGRVGSTDASFAVTYGGAGATTYTATCERVDNTRLRCATAPGSGRGLRWRVVVTDGAIVGDAAISAADVVTQYRPPEIVDVSSSALSMSTLVCGMGLCFFVAPCASWRAFLTSVVR